MLLVLALERHRVTATMASAIDELTSPHSGSGQSLAVQ
jgi:hypothetical protein